jgi:hypothetical protein
MSAMALSILPSDVLVLARHRASLLLEPYVDGLLVVPGAPPASGANDAVAAFVARILEERAPAQQQ